MLSVVMKRVCLVRSSLRPSAEKPPGPTPDVRVLQPPPASRPECAGTFTPSKIKF